MDIKLDSTGDIEVIDNNVSLTTGLDSKRQHLEIRMRTFLTEWFLDTGRGVPYFQEILIKNPNFNAVSAAFKSAILDTSGILELLAFNLEFAAARQLEFGFKCRAEEGDIDFSTLIDI